MSFCICNFSIFEDSAFIRSSDNFVKLRTNIKKKAAVAVSLFDGHDWNGIIAKSTQLALRTITELPLIWFGSIIDVDCWVVYIMKDINLNWFHWQWGCSGHMNKEWSSISMKILVLNLAKNTTNLKKLIILPSKKFEITTQHQFQILCKQLPLIPGKAFFM